MSATAYSPAVDALSEHLFDVARRLARAGADASARRERIRCEAEELERWLRALYDEGRGPLAREQFDGGWSTLGAVGGELGEIRAAAALALELVAAPDAARRLRRSALFYTSDVFHNVTLTGESSAGDAVHLRLGTHGGLALRRRAPDAEGFPWPGSKWVEGDLVIGQRVYGFVSNYTDAFEVRLDAETGAPVGLRFRGVVDATRVSCAILPSGPEKWTTPLPATPASARARLELSFELRASGGEARWYGVLGMGFLDRNFALVTPRGTIAISRPGGGGEETIAVDRAFGQLEEGQLRRLPRAIPIAYHFAQGQRVDTARALARALARDVAPLVPERSELRGALEQLGGALVPPELATRVDAEVRERARTDPELRRRAAPLLVAQLARTALPDRADDRTTSTQFSARLLAQRLAGWAVDALLAAGVRDAGRLDARGAFRSYPVRHGLWARDDLVDPVAVLHVNEVPLWRALSRDRFARARLERRTGLLFDARAGAFLTGFQEVFHDEGRPPDERRRAGRRT